MVDCCGWWMVERIKCGLLCINSSLQTAYWQIVGFHSTIHRFSFPPILVNGLLLLFVLVIVFIMYQFQSFVPDDPLVLHLLSSLPLQINECFKTGGPAFQQIFMRQKQYVVFVPFYHQPQTGYPSLYSIQQLLWLTYLISQFYGLQLA